jgi:hypothetical protein
MNNIIDKWKLTGLLDGTDDIHHEKLSNILENVMFFLIQTCPSDDNSPEKRSHERFSGTILPMVSRIFINLSDKSKFPDTCWLINDYLDYYKNNQKLLDKLMDEGYYAIDGEAEFVGQYCANVVNRIS